MENFTKPLKYKNFTSGGKLVKDNDQYELYDNDSLKRLIVSETRLRANRSTNGHRHKGQEEVYIFTSGKGKMEILELSENERVKSNLEFYLPFESKSTVVWQLEKIDSAATQVIWTNTGELDYPMGRYLGLGMDAMLGPSFEKGLQNLSAFLEAKE